MQSCFRPTDLWVLLPFFLFTATVLPAQPGPSAPPQAVPSGALSLAGPDTICAGSSATLSVAFSNGTSPFTFIYSMNGVQEAPVTTSANPYIFVTPILSPGTIQIKLDSVSAGGMDGLVSGDTMVTILPAPSATLLSDTVQLCAGQTDTVRIRFLGAGPYTFQYAVNGVVLPPVTTTDTLYKIPVMPPVGFTVFTLSSVKSGGCSGTVNGSYGMQVSPKPTASLVGDTLICAGTTASISVNFTGAPPFITQYTANGVPQKPDTSLFNPRTILVSPAVPTYYQLTGVSSNGCTGAVSGLAIVNVLPVLSAVITGGGQICQGDTGTTITITFQGTGPYTFTYSAGVNNQPPITTNANPFVIKVNPPVGTIYRLQSLSNNTCIGTVSGQAVVAVFTPSTAALAGDLTFCNQADTTLMVDFTGSGPFSLVYSADGVAQPEVETFDDPYFIPVSIKATTTYALISVESPGCIGLVNGQATVTVNYPPSYTGLKFNCNLVAGTYTVEFDVLNATLPLTLVTGSGAFAGTHFTSNPIPVALGYNFVFRDANDCGDIPVSGNSGCGCTTKAGTMNLAPIQACIGAMVNASHNGNQTLDANDLLRFILHTGPALPIGQIIAWSNTPSFSFSAGMQPNVTYYISAIAGNPDGAGNIDLNDPCLSVSQGAPVTFYALPLASIDSIAPVCPGGAVKLPVSLSGTPPFTLVYAINGVAQTPLMNIAATSVNLTIPVAGPTTVTLESVQDAHCTGTTKDTLVIPIMQPPQLSNLAITCNLAAGSYGLEFDAAGQAPFAASGVIGYFNGNHFTSLPIAASLPYSITVTDGYNCGQTLITGMADCVCKTDAGTMDAAQLDACIGSPVSAIPNGDASLQAGDVLQYVLHTSPDSTLGTIFSIQNQPVFEFLPGTMLPETVYYISTIAGGANASGGIDLAAPCLSVAPGTPVLWHVPPAVAIDGSFDICPGGSVTIPVAFTGTGPFTLTYTSNQQQNTVVAAQNTFSINATLLQSTVFQAISVTDAHCPGTADGQAIATVHLPPQITGINVTCAPDNLSYTVEFDVFNGDLGSTAVSGSVTGTVDPTTGHFISAPVAAQTGYTAIVQDSWQCGADSISGGANCSCATSAGTMDQTPRLLCFGDTVSLATASSSFLGPGDTLFYALVSTTSPSTWTILAQGKLPVFAFDPGSMTTGTKYYVVALAGNSMPGGVDFTDPCFTYSLGSEVIWQPQPHAVLGADTEICQGDTTTLTVSFSGNAPFSFIYRVGAVNQPLQNTSSASVDLPVSPAITTAYTLVSLEANGCPGDVAGGATVTVHPLPQILNPSTVCDLATLTYTLTFDISNGAAPNPLYAVGGVTGTLTDSTFVSDPIPSGQVYKILVTTPEGCTDTLTGTATCMCATNAGSLATTGTLSICLPGMAVVQTKNDAVLDNGDALQYILYQNPGGLPQSILATSNNGQFAFQAGWQTDVTYFIAVMAGNVLPDGTIDPTDPCLSISTGVPVVFHAPPTAMLAGDTTVCSGANVNFKIKFTGKSPFHFVYAINTNQQTGISAPQNMFTISTSNVQQDQLFTLISVQDSFCTGTVSGSYAVHIQPGPMASLASSDTICPGAAAILTLTLAGADTFNVTVNGGLTPIQLNGVQNGATFTVMPAATTAYTIGGIVAMGNSCTAKIGSGAVITVAPPITATAMLSEFNGFNISCPDETDGSISLQPTGGIPPLTVVWQHGANGLKVQNLPAGHYLATITDQVGCQWTDSFNLIAPPGLAIALSVESPTCFGDKDGQILVDSVHGGAGPYAISLNAMPGTTTSVFPVALSGLGSGTYQVSIADINGCETAEAVQLDDPPLLTVNLGPDTTIYYGDSILLNAITDNTGIQAFGWTPLSGVLDSTALSTYVKPDHSTVYSFWVQDSAGCRAQDDILISVRRDKRIYIPGAIRPGAANENGVFTVFAGPELRRVRTFRVYNRWGECVFERTDVEPNQPAQGWTGQWRGKEVPPGVYVYVLDLEYFNGETEVRSGEITVLR